MTPIAIVLIFVTFNSTLISALSTLVMWFWRNARGSRWLFYSMVAVTLWNLFAMLQRFTPDLSLDIWFYKLVYVGANTTTPLLLLFVIEYVFQRPVKKNQIAILFIIPVFGILMAFTNELHYQYWLQTIPNPRLSGDFIYIQGPAYWMSLLYNYLCGAVSIILLAFSFMFRRSPYRKQIGIILISSLFPMAAGIFFSIDNNYLLNLDVLPVTFSVMGMFVVAAIYSQKMLDLLPVAREILVENLKEGVIVIDQEDRIADINPAAITLFNVKDAVGRDIFNVFNAYPAIIELAQRNCYCLSELRPDSGGERIFEIQLVPLQGFSGGEMGKLIVVRDITLRKQMQTELEFKAQTMEMLAITDSMTGLFNRRHAEQRLLWEIQRAERYHFPLALGLIDIDNFKRVNDRTGHLCGDKVIIYLSDLMRNEVRSDDFIARVGGEEFMIVFPQTELSGAFLVMERLREKVERTVMPCYDEKVTISGGITRFIPGDTDEQFYQRADRLLMHAKSNGRNCIVHDGIEAEASLDAGEYQKE